MQNDGQYFDGVPVTLHSAKFTGTFDLSDEVGDNMQYDDVVTFLVTAVASTATVGTNAAGDMKRTNKLIISNVNFVDPAIVDAVRNNVVYANTVAPTAQDELDDILGI